MCDFSWQLAESWRLRGCGVARLLDHVLSEELELLTDTTMGSFHVFVSI